MKKIALVVAAAFITFNAAGSKTASAENKFKAGVRVAGGMSAFSGFDEIGDPAKAGEETTKSVGLFKNKTFKTFAAGVFVGYKFHDYVGARIELNFDHVGGSYKHDDKKAVPLPNAPTSNNTGDEKKSDMVTSVSMKGLSIPVLVDFCP